MPNKKLTEIIKNFTHVKFDLQKILIEYGLEEIYTCSEIKKYWDVIINQPLAKKTSPIRLEKKQLIILVEDSAYAHHLRYYNKNLISNIATICGDNKVKTIKYFIGKIPTQIILSPSEQITSKVINLHSTKISNQIKETINKIHNHRLKHSFKKLMLRYQME